MLTSAEYHDGVDSHREHVEISFNDDGSIHLIRGGKSLVYFSDDINFSSRLGNTPRVLTFPGNAACYIADNDLVDRFLKQHSPKTAASSIHLLESRLIFVTIAVAFTVLFTWSMVTHGIPYLSGRIAYNLPLDVDRALGKGALDALDTIVFSESTLDEESRDNLMRRFEEMKSQIADSDDYKMLFRRGGDIGANAFALPSGIILVTDELVELSESDDEVIAIIAHEFGHLVHRHSVRMALQDSAVAVMVATITGDPFSTSSLIVALPTILVNSRYSREFENEADDYAYQYLVTNGMQPSIFADILERITEGETGAGIENYLSSHPATRNRLQRFR